MPAILLTPPAAEPLSLADAKNYLRVEHDADDELIASLVASARREVELATRRVLVTQTWRLVLHRWPAPLVQAIRLLVALAYEHRDRIAPDGLPDTVAKLLAPFRVLSL